MCVVSLIGKVRNWQSLIGSLAIVTVYKQRTCLSASEAIAVIYTSRGVTLHKAICSRIQK